MKRLEIDFEGRTVLITGAATGIGRATALAFAAARASVVIGDVDPRAEATASDIVAAGGKAVFQKTDVSDSIRCRRWSRAVSEFGALDVAFNNAGLLPPTAPLAEQTEDDWTRIMRIDVTGAFLCLKHELAQMAKAGRGAIVNTASVAGLRTDPGMAPYLAAKHAVVGLTNLPRVDYAPQRIRVNAIAPGLVRTPMTERWPDNRKCGTKSSRTRPFDARRSPTISPASCAFPHPTRQTSSLVRSTPSMARIPLPHRRKRPHGQELREVAVIVGSLRKDSINRKVANALLELAPDGLKLKFVEIGQLPIYNQDGDDKPAAEWTAFRERIGMADAVLFVTPEHNRSVPAALKNAIDVGSRPYGKSAWSGKPGAIVCARPGGLAGSARTIICDSRLSFLNIPAMPHFVAPTRAERL